MASNSKKRRRVLGASCILAALIIASSSFAWFTSKDEVTNRLTASADYGVSIVESFTPPKNWIPGQKINKDTYNVNTGNIAAFVNNDITGKLTYTYETLANAVDTAKGVVLNKDSIASSIQGATTMQAGSFLAYTNTTEPLGKKDVMYDGSDWKPTATGIYIFRRSATTDGYEYAGYYYDASTDKYYKIVLGTDTYPLNAEGQYDVSSASLGDGVTIDEEGKVTAGTPTVKYVVENTKTVDNVPFVYDSTNHRLIVTDTAVAPAGVSGGFDASADAARKEIDYRNKKAISDDAVKAYNQGKNDLDYAVALANATNTLVDAADEAKAAHNTADNSATTTSADRDTIVAAATTLEGNADFVALTNPSPSIDPETVVTTGVKNKINALAKPSQAYDNYKELEEMYNDMYDTTDPNSLVSKINANIATLKGTQTNNLTSAQVAKAIADLKGNVSALNTALGNYKDKFAELIVEVSPNDTFTDLELSNATTNKDKIDTVKGKVASVNTVITNGVEASNTTYATDEATQTSNDAAAATQDAAWKTAIATYNTTVSAAKEAYLKKQSDLSLTDNSTTISNAYSAKASGGPVLETTASYADYATSTNGGSYVKKTVPTDTTYPTGTTVKDLKDDMDPKVATTNAAKAAYDAAMQALQTGGTITIYVNLDADEATNWTLDTTALTNDSTVASFYLNQILAAGATTPKLVDSVELADTVTQAAYKNMTFDLNIGLDSAQITYSDDQKTVLNSAVQAPAFGMTPTLTTPTSDTSALTWA